MIEMKLTADDYDLRLSYLIRDVIKWLPSRSCWLNHVIIPSEYHVTH
jgi:hypothetical protein